MAAKLKLEDYGLLDDLHDRGGVAQISFGRPRDGADRLVAAGYATVRSLNASDLEYEITPLGRTAHVLKLSTTPTSRRLSRIASRSTACGGLSSPP